MGVCSDWQDSCHGESGSEMINPVADPLLQAILSIQQKLEEEKRKNLEGLGPQQPPFTVIPLGQSDQSGIGELVNLIGKIPWGKVLGKLGGGGGSPGGGGGGSDSGGSPGSFPTRRDLPNLIGRR